LVDVAADAEVLVAGTKAMPGIGSSWTPKDVQSCPILGPLWGLKMFEGTRWGDLSGNLWILQQNGEKRFKIQPQHIRFSIKDLRTHFLEVLD
jgi:hypothetical protein